MTQPAPAPVSMMTLAQAHAMLPGSVVIGDAKTGFARVHTDTRTLLPGDLFVALKGERFDAHNFLAQAKAAGCAAVLAEHGFDAYGLTGLKVTDTLAALQALATAWRHGVQLPLIAVTGSNGKTTVTQMIAAILRAWIGDSALATAGNLNNHIGVPLTLLRLRQDAHLWHRAAVLELGMNHPGEIEALARMAQPTVVLVNNAQREHQEFMAGVEAVARENGSAIKVLGSAGTAVFPAKDEHSALWQALAGTRPQLTFAIGHAGTADVSARAAWQGTHWAVAMHTPAGSARLKLRLAGLHNVKNALAAAACALAAGATLKAIHRGLESFEPVKGRSQVHALKRAGQALTLVDDSYNANPDSVRAAIEVLAALPGPHWLVLGDMGEVGTRGSEFHAEVGTFAREQGIEHLWTAGSASAETARAHGAARHFADVPALLQVLTELPACASILVKGSRFMQMERVVQALLAQEGTGAA
jgi:UDP-N-acetylmuramoyl-tripeptide--D-alanyl-D-alanine ligase